MSTQINNAQVSSESITPTFESLHYIYASTKSPTGYVISKKRLPNKDAVWCVPSEDQAQHWISHQVLMKQRQAAINGGMTKAQAVETITLDTLSQSSYNVETTKVEDTTMNTIDINAMTLQELASLQFKIANRMNYLITQQALQQSNENTTQPEQLEAVQPEVVDAPSVEPQNTAPSSAPEVKAKRKIKSKKATNVEAVENKIEATLCALTRDEAREFIKLNKLPIKGNMSCENLNDAINAFNAGGIECVPVAYLTKAGADKVAKGFAKKEAAVPAKKTIVKSKSSKVK